MTAETADATADNPDAEGPEPTPLSRPADGVPDISASPRAYEAAAERLAGGHGPFAVDAERASGFRYSNRAYLIQIRRAGAGTVLIDPIGPHDPTTALHPVAQVLGTDEWILHAADQDLPCLAELGMRPAALYDTELAGRLAGFERVNLAAMVQRLLGLGLAKGHGAADWSKRPLPEAWLNYAALDVEVLIELRNAVSAILTEQGKDGWAAQEFDFVRRTAANGTTTRRDRWRRTSGIHKVRDRRGLAAVQALWEARDRVAQRRDVAPGRVLPDSAIIAAAIADPQTVAELTALPVYGGPKQRRNANIWFAALSAARADPDPPRASEANNGPPPPNRWSRRKPDAMARLDAVRAALSEISDRVGVPTENLLAPDIVRRLCWDWNPAAVSDPAAAVAEVLHHGGARPWQWHLVSDALVGALGAAGR